MSTANPLLRPLGLGPFLLFSNTLEGRGGGGGGGRRYLRGGLFNLAKTMVSVLHKELV